MAAPATSAAVSDVLTSPAVALLWRLEDEGFQVAIDGDRLLVSPFDRLGSDFRAQLREHKPELLMLIKACDAGVQDRRGVFAAALEAGAAPGLLVTRRGVPYAAGLCFSCGEDNGRKGYGKCWRCALAWRLALRLRLRIPVDLAVTYNQLKLLA